MCNCIYDIFQSTPLSLAETKLPRLQTDDIVISIHSAIASGDGSLCSQYPGNIISIHSAIASGDIRILKQLPKRKHFNPLRYR